MRSETARGISALVPRRLGRRLAREYDRRYFDNDAPRVRGVSGYGTYDRRASNADVAAYVLWRFLPFESSLDIGCAKGYVVEALTELGYEAAGCDLSAYAISQAPTTVRDRVRTFDLTSTRTRRSFGREHRFDLVTVFEVLEHIPPRRIAAVLRFLRVISAGYVVATIPSVGTNRNGPDGLLSGKVRDDRLRHYQSLGADYAGPVPRRDLMRDDDGRPIEGHVTIASYDWWTERFEAAGFRRVDDVERLMHPVIGRFDLSVGWNLYVFHVAGCQPAPSPTRTEREIAEVERRWALTDRQVGAHSLNITNDTVGPAGVDAIWNEYNDSQRRREALDATDT